MNVIRTAEQEASEDVFFGQIVIVWARWFLIASGAVIILTGLGDQASLIGGTIPIVLLMFMNLYLHGRYLMEKPVGVPIIALTSLLDLVIITLLVFFWPTEGVNPSWTTSSLFSTTRWCWHSARVGCGTPHRPSWVPVLRESIR